MNDKHQSRIIGGIIGGAILLIIILVVGWGHRIPSEPPPAGIDYDYAASATVILTGEHSLFSGVIISPDGLVLTVAHGGKPEWVYALKDVEDLDTDVILRYPVRYVYWDKTLDLAVWQIISDQEWPYMPLASDPLDIGDEIFAIGAPLGGPYYISWGRVIASRYRGDVGLGYYLHSASGNQGSSGGPVFNTSGEVVGLNVAMYAALWTMAGYVPLLDGTVAVQLYELLPALEGIIASWRKLDAHVKDLDAARQYVKEYYRDAPD